MNPYQRSQIPQQSIYTVLLIVGAALVFTYSCSDNSTSTDTIDENETIINPNTKDIDEKNWLESVQKIDSTNFTLTFDEDFDEAESWQEGDLLVSAEGEGLLRTVTNVTRENGSIAISTEQATLVDYIQQGKISERISLGIEDVQKVTYSVEGIKLLQDPDEIQAHKLYTEKREGLPWKLDTEFEDEGSIELFGDYLLETDLIFELDVRFPARLFYYEMSYELKNTLDNGLKAERSVSVSSSVELAKVTFSPIYIIIPGIPVPIVIVPTLVVSVGVDGNVAGEIYTDVNYEDLLKVGIMYERDEGWSEILEQDEII